MPITKKTPARLSPGEGERQSTRWIKCNPLLPDRQDKAPSAEVHTLVSELLNGKGISCHPQSQLQSVLKALWGPHLRFFRGQRLKGGEYFVGFCGRVVRLGRIGTIISQARFRRALAAATDRAVYGFSVTTYIPHYTPEVWGEIVRCLLSSIDRCEVPYV